MQRDATVEAKGQALKDDVFKRVIEQAATIGLALIVWGGKSSSGGPFVVGEYLPETVRTISDLADRAALYGLQDRFRAAILLVRNRFGRVQYKIPLVLTLFFVVRRPADIIGKGSEPPRDCRRHFRLSHAAMADCSIMA